MPVLPRSTVDDVIDAVVNQAYNSDDNDDLAEAAIEVDVELWCVCKKPSEGDMIACDNANCKIEWFHFDCVGIRKAPRGKWYCLECRSNNSTKRKLNFENEINPKKQKKNVKRENCPKCDHMLASSYIKLHMKKFCVGFKVNDL